MANRNFTSHGKIYSGHTKPILIDCNFVVASSAGLGISGLKGPCVQNVFMHTTTTPAVGNSGLATPNIKVTNPNPAAGTIVVQLQDSYNRCLSLIKASIVATSGSAVKIDNSDLTQGVAYVISTLGDASAATWHALGVPAGVTPAVGVSFIAASVGAGSNTSTSRVMAAAAKGSGCFTVEFIGSPDLSVSPDPGSRQGFGAQLILQCRKDDGSIAAPADGSLIFLSFLLDDSSNRLQEG